MTILTYALTITLNPILYEYSQKIQHRMSEPYIDELNPQTYVAEQTKSGNIHYHMILTSDLQIGAMRRWIELWLKDHDKIFGFIYRLSEKKTRHQIDTYIEYMKKAPYTPDLFVDEVDDDGKYHSVNVLNHD